MKDFAEFVRALVRPVVTLALVGLAMYGVATAISIPDWLQSVITLVIGFWFGSRVKATP